MNFAAINNIQLRGHTLLWHRHDSDRGCSPAISSNPANYRATIQQNLRDYIFAVIQHFPNVYAWDVVNEVASDTQNSANPYRTDSPGTRPTASADRPAATTCATRSHFANQARASIGRNSADMKLMLNDYNTELPGKRANVIQIVRDAGQWRVPIDGVGHQFHLQLSADVTQVTAAFEAVEACVEHAGQSRDRARRVHLRGSGQLLIRHRAIPPCQADYGANPPQTVLSSRPLLYRALFNAFNRPSVTSVSLWGIADNHTWLNTFPVTRTNRPLLFDTARPSQMGFLDRGRSCRSQVP